MYEKGVVEWLLNDRASALKVWQDLVGRFSEAEEPEIREIVAVTSEHLERLSEWRRWAWITFPYRHPVWTAIAIVLLTGLLVRPQLMLVVGLVVLVVVLALLVAAIFWVRTL